MNPPSLGIDIAQRTFVAALRFDSHRFVQAQFANQAGGFRQLRRWLQQHFAGQVRAGLESTNVFGEALAQWLHDQGHLVYLLNPERTAHYARALGQRNKTDAADALMIAGFVAHHELTRWQPAPPAQQQLRALTRTRRQLVDTRTHLSQQLRTAAAIARPHLQAVLTAVNQQLRTLTRAIACHLQAHPSLHRQACHLMTFDGVALITAATVLAELPPITPHSDARAICAWVGLVPRRCQSGALERPSRLSRKGNTHLRNALYMPALVAKRHNPLLRAFAQRLAAKGKRTPAILGAVAHKMLRILVGLLRSNSDFDPNWSPQKN